MLRIDHAGKDLKKGARGTSAKNDDVDLVWQMTRNDNTVTLKSTKKRHTWIKEKILFTVNKTEQMFTTSSKGQDIHGRCQAFHTAHSVPLTMPASKVLEQYLDIMKQEFGVSKNAYESFRRELKDAELFNSADQ